MLQTVTREIPIHSRPDGHVLVPVAAIGGLSLALCGGLSLLGPLERVNAMIAGFVSRGGLQDYPNRLPAWSIWLATVIFAFGLAYAILATAGNWRRVLLWISAVVLVAAWAPVLSLCAHAPAIAAPWIATVWSGVCALVYAGNHRMPCDEPGSHPS
jgi:hypothetical protein